MSGKELAFDLGTSTKPDERQSGSLWTATNRPSMRSCHLSQKTTSSNSEDIHKELKQTEEALDRLLALVDHADRSQEPRLSASLRALEKKMVLIKEEIGRLASNQ